MSASLSVIVSSMASGASRNNRVISPGGFRWRSALDGELAAGAVDRGLLADTGEHVGERPPVGMMEKTSLTAISGTCAARASSLLATIRARSRPR